MRRPPLARLCVVSLLVACSDVPDGAPGDAADDRAEAALDVDDVAPVEDVAPDAAPDAVDEPDAALDAADAPDVAADTVDAPAAMDARDATPDVTADAPPDAPRDVATEAISDAGVRPTRAWIGVVGTGQSLSVGAIATRPIHTTQPYNNRVLRDTGSVPLYDGMGDVLSLGPLVEPIRPRYATPPYPAGPLYPNNIYGETPHSAMANDLTARVRAALGEDYVTVHSVVGESGQSITRIERNGTGRAFAASLYEARAVTALARTAGVPFAYRAVIVTHGETDTARATYGAELYRLRTDYDRELRAITGQSERVVMLVSQQASFPNTMGTRSISTQAQWRIGVDHPGEVVCIGPKYQYAYADAVHFDAYGYARLGIKYAQVFYEVVVRGNAWRPLQPRAARRAGAVITVDMDVPVAPLAWDTSITAPHQSAYTEWAMGRGFEVEDSTGRLRITNIQIMGTSVAITLAAAPRGTGLMVRYAMTQDVAGYAGGPTTGRRGQLRDSDPYVGSDRAVIRARVTRGSAMVTGVAANAFAARGVRDLVEGTGLMGETMVTARADGAVTLSRPWMGATGEAELTFRSDQRNYCVQFEMPVP
jgi:hypothetical protein